MLAISDADKQNAINLFLGVFNPQESRIPIWEQQSDAHLHRGNPFNLKSVFIHYHFMLTYKKLTLFVFYGCQDGDELYAMVGR